MTNPRMPEGYIEVDGLAVRYQLAYDPADGTATIVRDVRAGVSGPIAGTTGIDDRGAAARYAHQERFMLAGNWSVGGNGSHWAPLEPLPAARAVHHPTA